MQVDEHRRGTGGNEITILRVKRKRGQEPLDALVIHQQQQQSQRRRLTTDHDGKVFELGQTLSQRDYDDQAKRQALQTRLAQLSQTADHTSMEDTPMETIRLSETRKQPRFRVNNSRQQAEDRPIRSGIPQVVAAYMARHTADVRILDAVRDDDQGPLDVDDLVPLVRGGLALQNDDPEYLYDFYYEARNGVVAGASGTVLWTEDDDASVAGSESEHADQEEEDSNAEDYYANDYPDDPDSSSDGDAYYYGSDERERMRSEARAHEYDDDNDDYDCW
ncbi:hypothetical protein H4R99_007628 [Coemansia sp. RSA 1722]|nr:hypothetical protein LPJ57_002164 [Coemansia sp. RSA 486]KAJ2226648.1 hypothetical protein IWW45_007370 [Coemansia sp. RSA 485]KAJ2588959.1 hypothetical protein H4R99_007628 [Coemansia sp. RSA 1722]KAJ2600829.1 hypothetical protein GGF39_001593 [Coemansia sp. RSA 1721]